MLLENKKIVYIEDDQRNRKMVEMILAADGAKVYCERWGVPAMAIDTIIGYWPIDLILLDLMFTKGYNGYDVFTEIRRMPLLADVPVVMISAADAEVEMPKARQLGFTSYIPKPIDADTFAEQISTVLNGQNIWQTVEFN